MNTRIKEIRTSKKLTLDKFGESIGLKKSALSLIESGKNAVTERTIKDICREYNVNEDWLRTGQGEMFIDISHEEEIADLTYKLLKEEPSSFKNRLISALSRLSDEQWDLLEQIIDDISAQKKE